MQPKPITQLVPSIDTCLEPRSRALRVDCGGRLADGLGGGGQGGADLGGGDFQRVRRRVGDLAEELSLRLFNLSLRATYNFIFSDINKIIYVQGVLLGGDDGALRVKDIVDDACCTFRLVEVKELLEAVFGLVEHLRDHVQGETRVALMRSIS